MKNERHAVPALVYLLKPSPQGITVKQSEARFTVILRQGRPSLLEPGMTKKQKGLWPLLDKLEASPQGITVKQSEARFTVILSRDGRACSSRE
jgi:hypothetical protein